MNTSPPQRPIPTTCLSRGYTNRHNRTRPVHYQATTHRHYHPHPATAKHSLQQALSRKNLPSQPTSTTEKPTPANALRSKITTNPNPTNKELATDIKRSKPTEIQWKCQPSTVYYEL